MVTATYDLWSELPFMLSRFSVNTAIQEASGFPLRPPLFLYLLNSKIVRSATLSYRKTRDPSLQVAWKGSVQFEPAHNSN